MMKAACVSCIGKRPTHEDNFLLNGRYLDEQIQQKMPVARAFRYQATCFQNVSIIAISDGMGGHSAGEVASLFCTQKLAEIESQVQDCVNLQEVIDRIQEQIPEINRKLCEKSRTDENLSGMGATLVMFVSCASKRAVLNIGDSRAYEVKENRIVQLTRDHTEGQRMLDLGILTRKELNQFPARKHLNRYFGYENEGYVLQADVFYPKQDSMILLCSDGVSDFLSEQEIIEFLLVDREIQKACWDIVDMAVHSPCSDNATAILIDCRG